MGKLALLVLQNLGRNPLRTTLTVLGTMVLVFVVTLVWSILDFLNQATTEKSNNLKAIVSERWRLPSQMPYAYAQGLREAGAALSIFVGYMIGASVRTLARSWT